MSWFSDLGNQIGSISTWGASDKIGKAVGRGSFNDRMNGAVGLANLGTAPGIINALSKKNGPDSPGIDNGLQSIQDQEAQQAKDFRNNIPQNESSLGLQLKRNVNNQLQGDTQNLNASNSSRGLLYGGINAGGEQSLRSGANQTVAKGQMNINNALEGQANKNDQQAISTALAVRNQSQDLQNQIWANSMAQMSADNQMYSSFGGAAIKGLIGI